MLTTTEKQRRASHALGVFQAAENWLRRREPAVSRGTAALLAKAKLETADRWLATQAMIDGNRFKLRGHWFPLAALEVARLQAGTWHVVSIDGTDFQLDDAEMYRWRDALAKAKKGNEVTQ